MAEGGVGGLIVQASAALVATYVLLSRARLSCKRSGGSRVEESLLTQIETGTDSLFKESVDVMAAAMRIYSPGKMMISFNGGKDATAVLHLSLAALEKYAAGNPSRKAATLSAVYFHNPDKAFEGTLPFVESTCKKYKINLTVLLCGYKEGLAGLVAKGFKAFVIGTRSTDPNGKSGEFYSPSSEDWPVFMRINPIINWDYGSVWRFLRNLKIPYFPLYDKGYTSLGSRHSTFPNSLLLNKDGTYRPAYTLQNWESERLVRQDSKTSQKFRLKSLMGTKRLRVALVVTGDEVLSMKVRDQNTPYAAQKLLEGHMDLGELVIVGDDVNQVSEHIRRLSRSFDVVVTSGGVGPTHDDVTMHAVAKAFHCGLRQEEKLLKAMGNVETNIAGKLAMVPSPAQCLEVPGNKYPLLRCYNVYILPGVPKFFQEKLSFVIRFLQLKHPECKQRIYHKKILLSINDEAKYSRQLAQLQHKHQKVKFGTYPFVARHDCKAVIMVEGVDELEVSIATKDLIKLFTDDVVVGVEDGHKISP
eukprot:jgi/Bigna1/51833/estExt_Genewise1Plus.C_30263